MDYDDNTAQYMNTYGVKYNRFRKRKRRPFKWGNSTGVSVRFINNIYFANLCLLPQKLFRQ